MTQLLTKSDIEAIRRGYDENPARSQSLAAEAYVEPKWLKVEREAIFFRTWQWCCHVEKLRRPGDYQAAIRMRMDTTQLPKPFQLNAVASSDWNLASDWYRWTVNP